MGGTSKGSHQPVRVQALDLYKCGHAVVGQSHALTITEQVWNALFF